MDIEGVQQNALSALQQGTGLGNQIDHRERIAPETLQKLKGQKYSRKQLEQVTQGVEHFFTSMGKKLNFHIHEESNRIQVEVIDPESEKVIRKIPPDEILDLAASIERTVGLFLDRIL